MFVFSANSFVHKITENNEESFSETKVPPTKWCFWTVTWQKSKPQRDLVYYTVYEKEKQQILTKKLEPANILPSS